MVLYTVIGIPAYEIQFIDHRTEYYRVSTIMLLTGVWLNSLLQYVRNCNTLVPNETSLIISASSTASSLFRLNLMQRKEEPQYLIHC
jgi:hypothetical protein